MKYNVYNIDNCDFIGMIEFNNCVETMDISTLEHKYIIDIFEPLFESYNKEIFNNRFDGIWFIFINSKTLKPALEISYFDDRGEKCVLVDIPESDTRATFFENLFEKYVNNMSYYDSENYCTKKQCIDENIVDCKECEYFYRNIK